MGKKSKSRNSGGGGGLTFIAWVGAALFVIAMVSGIQHPAGSCLFDQNRAEAAAMGIEYDTAAKMLCSIVAD